MTFVPTDETLTVPHDMIRGGNNYVLRVKGDAMGEDHIRDGDFVIVNDRTTPYVGETVILKIKETGDVTIASCQGDGSFKSAKADLWPDEATVQGILVSIIRKC